MISAAAKSLQLCPTVRPHRWQPTRLPCLWDSPGKNAGVGCHFLLQCMKVKSENEVAQSSPTLATPWTAAYQAPLSMGFSRQEYWSGVPLPSPIMISVPENICLKSGPTRFPGARSASLHPELPQEVLKVNTCSSTRFNLHPGRWQMPLLFTCWQFS